MRPACSCVALIAGALLLPGCGGEPFPMVKASGKLTYEDGSLLPFKSGDMVGILFIPQVAPLGPQTHPRMGSAVVNPEDGTFESATTHKFGDGLIRGKHKILVYINKNFSAVPPEYADPDTTPLECDASQQPLELRVRKPR